VKIKINIEQKKILENKKTHHTQVIQKKSFPSFHPDIPPKEESKQT